VYKQVMHKRKKNSINNRTK